MCLRFFHICSDLVLGANGFFRETVLELSVTKRAKVSSMKLWIHETCQSFIREAVGGDRAANANSYKCEESRCITLVKMDFIAIELKS